MFTLEKEKIPETNIEIVKIGIIYIKENDVIYHEDKEQIDKFREKIKKELEYIDMIKSILFNNDVIPLITYYVNG